MINIISKQKKMKNYIFIISSLLILSSCSSNDPAPIEYSSNNAITHKNNDVKVKVKITQHSSIANDEKDINQSSDEQKNEQSEIDGFTIKTKRDETIENINNKEYETRKNPEIVVKKPIVPDQNLSEQLENELAEDKQDDNFLNTETTEITKTPEDNSDLIDIFKFSISPTNGKIIKQFKQGSEGFEAIIFGSPKGSLVKSVSEGNVVFAGFDPKFGNIVIIGYKDFQIAYGYIKELVVKTGSSVKTGDIIGYIGDIVNSKNSGLYFAIRRNNIPIDPQTLLP
jgi:murein DD-endopeptidase MepM/ murein hydrolase activator NlpD